MAMLMSRSGQSARRRHGSAAQSSFEPTETPVASLELAHRLEQMLSAEVGPQHVGEDELAVGELPQQEVRDPKLARRANHDIGIGHLRVVEMAGDGALVDLVRTHTLGDQGTYRVDDRGPAPGV